DLTGSIERPDGYEWFRNGSSYRMKTEAAVFCDAAGDIRAYAARDISEEAVTVCEAAAFDRRHFADVVRWAAEIAVALRLEKIGFLLPPDSPFGVALTRYGAT